MTRATLLLQGAAAALVVGGANAAAVSSPTKSCASLASSLANYTDFTITNATHYEANATFSTSSAGGSGTNQGLGMGMSYSGLPAFCRVEINLNTYNNSPATAEVWLPDSDSYKGRYLTAGNGGLGGSINYGALAYSGLKNGFAAASTDGGHSSQNATEWALENPYRDDAIIDFGWRAIYTMTEAAKVIVAEYYGKKAKNSYYVGCSDGGRQGLKSIQKFPEQFDGVVVGSPANFISHQQAWSIWMSKHVLPVNGSSWIPSEMWPVIGAEVDRQCDLIDGVADGIINDPRKCDFDPSYLACNDNATSTSDCLGADQITAVRKIFAPWVDANQTTIFDGYYPVGSADASAYATVHLAATAPDMIGLSFYRNFVYNDTTWAWENLTAEDAFTYDEVNPGDMVANSPDLRGFAGESHGGKLLHYVGLADPNISPGNPLTYHRRVREFMTLNSDVDTDDFYRFFPVPAMAHCSGGSGANAFGSADSSSSTPPLAYDADHSALLAMVKWVEEGEAPDKIVAAKYIDDDSSNGLNFTRPICAYPREITYKGEGSIWNATNFECV